MRVEAWLEASINAYQTIGVETVLSQRTNTGGSCKPRSSNNSNFA